MSEKPFCLMPWIHLHSGDKGMVKVCCVAPVPFGNINKMSPDELWNGKPIQALRQKFLNQEPDKRCAQCINLEAAGGKSIRQETFEKFSDISIAPDELITSKRPVYFDIRFSNACNFKCRTCWHGASSAWFKEAKIIGNNIGNRAVIQNIENFDQFINDWGNDLIQAKEIYFAGGEPLFTEQHYLLLEFLVRHKATHCLLRYNTNFSMLNYKNYDLFNLWKHFKHIEILASIDGFGTTGEYIRSGMQWDTIVNNYQLLSEQKGLSFDFKIAPTVSILNIFHLPELFKKVVHLNMIKAHPGSIYLNILERPDYYNIQALPKTLKNKVLELYSNFFDWIQTHFPSISDELILRFQECLEYMSSKDRSGKYHQFQKVTKEMDALRNEQFMLWKDFDMDDEYN